MTRHPGFPGIVLVVHWASRCPGKVCWDAYFVPDFFSGHPGIPEKHEDAYFVPVFQMKCELSEVNRIYCVQFNESVIHLNINNNANTSPKDSSIFTQKIWSSCIMIY